MPAVLTENLFIDDPRGGALLGRANFLAQVGGAHARGIARALALPARRAADATHRVVVDGRQVGAFRKDQRVANAVLAALGDGASRILVERL